VEIPFFGEVFKFLRDNGRRRSERRQEERRQRDERRAERENQGRRDSEQRHDNSRRTETRERHDVLKRWIIGFLKSHRMPKAAEIVKSTKLIHPTVTAVTALLSAITYSPLMGLAVGVGLMFALTWHEWGHFDSTKKCGLTPKWWWNIPFLGAVMRLPEIVYRIDEALIAYGGPRAGWWCSLFIALLWFALDHLGIPREWGQVLYTTAVASTVLNLFNLIPISPLDGGRMAQAFPWYLPQILRVLGFGALLFVTMKTKQPSMLVVWILVMGEFRLSIGKFELPSFWRFFTALCLLLLMFYKLGETYHGFTLWSKAMWEIIGEGMYATLGVIMVYTYYRRWRYPDEEHSNDWRNQSVLKKDQWKMLWRYAFVVLRLSALFAVLISFSPK